MSQKLTPDLASKVIRADLKNIIDKVGAGKPLSGVERNLFDGLRLTTEDIGKKRQLSLLGKWSNGKRLNDAELLEIADLLPEGSIPDPEPAQVVERKKGRNGYYELYSFYVEQFEVSLRTVKRWVELGRIEKDGVTDPCPLDDPEALYAWLPRHVNRAVPPGVLKALIEWRKMHPNPSAVVDSEAEYSEPIESEEPVPESQEPVSDEEKGLDAMLQRLEEREVLFYRVADQPGQAKPWLDTISRMTSVITKLRDEKEKHSRLIPREMAESMIHEYHGPIEAGVRGLFEDFCRDVGLPWTVKNEEVWRSRCDHFFVALKKEVFREV